MIKAHRVPWSIAICGKRMIDGHEKPLHHAIQISIENEPWTIKIDPLKSPL
jgi:hypothetical protein